MKIALIIGGVIVLYFIISALLFKRKMKNYNPSLQHESIKNLTDTNFEEIISNGVSLVDFWADWCMPCKMQAPIIDEVAKDLGEKANICKLDIQTYNNLAGKFNIQSIPSIIIFKNGKEIKRFVGIKSKNILVKEIENNLF